jgi:hypothetical protein
MKKTLRKTLTLGFLLIGITFYGQEFEFDIHNTSLSDYLEMERNLGSEKIPNIRNHVSSNENAQPIKFKRKQKIISDLVAYYYFKEKDSLMSHILYEWDESLLTLKSNTNDKKSKEYQKALIRKFNELEKMIADIYGKPETTGDLSNLKQANEKGGLKKKVKWFPNDSTEIEMYTSVSNYYEKKGMMTIAPTHRIRLYIRNQSKEKEKEVPKLDKKKLSELEKIKIDFFKVLKSKDLPKSKEYLSEIIKEKVTDEQLNLLIDNIDFERETELIYSGIQMGFNGSMFILLQYKYSDDSSSPPNEMIKLIFDDKDKVVGIQPIKMQGEIKE